MRVGACGDVSNNTKYQTQESIYVIPNIWPIRLAKFLDSATVNCETVSSCLFGRGKRFKLKSLIMAQIERWRQA